MSVFSRFFRRKQDNTPKSTAEVNNLVVEDVDLDYVYVYKIEERLVKKPKRHEVYAEDPAEVDVSAWEMARTWVRRDSDLGGSHKRDRLASKLDNIRHASLGSNSTKDPVHVVEYDDESMAESLQLQFDDKWHRKEKVEGRRVKFNKHIK